MYLVKTWSFMLNFHNLHHFGQVLYMISAILHKLYNLYKLNIVLMVIVHRTPHMESFWKPIQQLHAVWCDMQDNFLSAIIWTACVQHPVYDDISNHRHWCGVQKNCYPKFSFINFTSYYTTSPYILSSTDKKTLSGWKMISIYLNASRVFLIVQIDIPFHTNFDELSHSSSA